MENEGYNPEDQGKLSWEDAEQLEPDRQFQLRRIKLLMGNITPDEAANILQQELSDFQEIGDPDARDYTLQMANLVYTSRVPEGMGTVSLDGVEEIKVPKWNAEQASMFETKINELLNPHPPTPSEPLSPGQ